MRITRYLARSILRLLGWECIDVPDRPARAVVVGYPHTSNWDFPIGLLAMAALGLDARWVGKDTLFRWPFGGLMRRLGGIPVNRREHTGFVERVAGEILRHDRFMLVIAPEGTRSLRPGWKSGFYRIARAAGVREQIVLENLHALKTGIGHSPQLAVERPADRDCRDR